VAVALTAEKFPLRLNRFDVKPAYMPMWMRDIEWITPNMLSSHTTTQTTTTKFRIDLIDPAIGINRLINHRATPTTISTTTMFSKGMASFLSSSAIPALTFKNSNSAAREYLFACAHGAPPLVLCALLARMWNFVIR
jgi:hypothetical protein